MTLHRFGARYWITEGLQTYRSASSPAAALANAEAGLGASRNWGLATTMSYHRGGRRRHGGRVFYESDQRQAGKD